MTRYLWTKIIVVKHLYFQTLAKNSLSVAIAILSYEIVQSRSFFFIKLVWDRTSLVVKKLSHCCFKEDPILSAFDFDTLSVILLVLKRLGPNPTWNRPLFGIALTFMLD